MTELCTDEIISSSAELLDTIQETLGEKLEKLSDCERVAIFLSLAHQCCPSNQVSVEMKLLPHRKELLEFLEDLDWEDAWKLAGILWRDFERDLKNN